MFLWYSVDYWYIMVILNTNDWGDTMSNRKKKLKIFISYSHKNIKYKEKLLTSLEALKQSYEIEAWHDGMIDAGGNIDENIITFNPKS